MMKACEDAADPDVMAGRPVVVGVDGSEQALHAAEWAAREAVSRKAPLRIISVSAMPSRMRPYSATPATVADTLRKMSARALAVALARAASDPGIFAAADEAAATADLAEVIDGRRDKYPEVRVSQQVIRGHPGRVLARRSAGADLVVIGRHGGPHRARLGSIQHPPLSHARGAIAVVPSVI